MHYAAIVVRFSQMLDLALIEFVEVVFFAWWNRIVCIYVYGLWQVFTKNIMLKDRGINAKMEKKQKQTNKQTNKKTKQKKKL